ncbi:integrase [Gossypium australe]|uniref:Integrase n=1 Tax=Gossypium australe TaxID=47621 RepID=A0A5B6VY48_9ROSI|nr:integrase [Gossypium australe]
MVRLWLTRLDNLSHTKELNLRQRRWVELLKNYDCTIECHPGKANVLVDAFSHRAMTNLRAMFARLSLFDDGDLLAKLQVKPTWVDQIRSLVSSFRQVEDSEISDFGLNSDRVLCFKDRKITQKFTKLYDSNIVRLHRVPVLIISERDPRFTSRF